MTENEIESCEGGNFVPPSCNMQILILTIQFLIETGTNAYLNGFFVSAEVYIARHIKSDVSLQVSKIDQNFTEIGISMSSLKDTGMNFRPKIPISAEQ